MTRREGEEGGGGSYIRPDSRVHQQAATHTERRRGIFPTKTLGGDVSKLVPCHSTAIPGSAATRGTWGRGGSPPPDGRLAAGGVGARPWTRTGRNGRGGHEQADKADRGRAAWRDIVRERHNDSQEYTYPPIWLDEGFVGRRQRELSRSCQPLASSLRTRVTAASFYTQGAVQNSADNRSSASNACAQVVALLAPSQQEV